MHDFRNHPFRVVDDDEMQDLVQNIREKVTLLTTPIVRTRPEGGYEVISGHRRKHAGDI